MRTNVELDNKLMNQAMASSEAKTKRAVIEEGLQMLVRVRAQASVRELFGTVKWEGDLESSRLGRFSD